MVPKKALAISILVVFLSGTVSPTLLPASAQKDYCPQSVEKKYCHKVIIIGAGIAGLGAAVELKSNPLLPTDDFVILEKENRTGGRVNTSTLNNVPIDLHASWISGIYGNPTYELAQKYNKTGDTAGKIILKKTDDNDAVYYGNSTSDAGFKIWNETFQNYYNKIREKRIENKSSDESMQVVINQFINDTIVKSPYTGHPLSPGEKRDFLFEASSYLGNEYGSDPSDLSLFYWDKVGYIIKYHKNGTQSDQVVFQNGYESIIKGLVTDIGKDKIWHNTTVQEVDYDNQGVTVKTNNGNFYGQYVISTLPLNVLKTSSVKFVPDLPQSKVQATDKAKMGVLDKTYFLFPKLFWDDTKDWLNYISPLDNEKGRWISFWNLYKINGTNMLMAFNYGDYANNTLEKMPGGEEEIKMAGLKVLDKMYPGKVLPLANQTHIHHVYSGKEGGSYSISPVGFVIPDDYDELVKPLTDNYGVNRVFFAGEATTWHAPGLTNGAYETGIREANRLIMTDSGTLYHPAPPEWQEKNLRYPIQIYQNQTWHEFPEYIICRPDLMVVLEKYNDQSPLCVKPGTASELFKRNVILDPKVDPNHP